jgi:hypothetical protein
MVTTTRKTPIKYKRGRDIPRLRHGDLVDLTTWPLHSKPLDARPIELCPVCGRKGQRSRYRGGHESYTHLQRFETFFWMVKESCDVRAQA